jgi:hypothetical protein
MTVPIDIGQLGRARFRGIDAVANLDNLHDGPVRLPNHIELVNHVSLVAHLNFVARLIDAVGTIDG